MKSETTVLTTVSGIFYSSERHIWFSQAKTIDEYHSCIKIVLGQIFCFLFIFGKNRATQSESGTIGNSQGIFCILCPNERSNGTKDFIIICWLTRFQVFQNSSRVEISFFIW